MDGRKEKGSITVFLSLTCILFLSLICTVVESARVQGAKAQTANITGMGNFSVLGEFEKELLDEYEIFSLDGSYGKGSFSIDEVNRHLETFLTCNADPKEGMIFPAACFDPWKLQLDESEIKKYALLTDDGGEPFYQQAAACMKGNISEEIFQHFMEDLNNITGQEEEYKKKRQEAESGMSEEKKAGDEKVRQLESEAAEEGTEVVLPEGTKGSNLLKEILKLSRKSLLNIVTGGKAVSEKSVSAESLPSRARNQEGTMKIDEKVSKELFSDFLFQEYLLNYFPNYTDEDSAGGLNYQLEYILGGKDRDEDNLKYTIKELLKLRKWANFACCAGNVTMNSQAGTLAFAMTGFLGMPVLTKVIKLALLLAWAYGESLIDVKILLDKGKVPLMKTPASWVLTFERLGQLSDILSGKVSGSSSGQEYTDHLKVLLFLGKVKEQKMRALDMIQTNLRKKAATSEFKAENCIVGIETETKWTIKPVFFSLVQAVMKIQWQDVQVTQTGSMVYE